LQKKKEKNDNNDNNDKNTHCHKINLKKNQETLNFTKKSYINVLVGTRMY